MKKIVSNTVLFSLMLFSAYASAASDLSKTFPDMEKDCAISKDSTRKVLEWLVPDANGKIMKVMPSILNGIGGAPQVTDASDHWEVEVPVKDAVYKGQPVVSIQRWAGKNNGISGYALVFANKLSEVAKHLKTPKPNPDSEETLPVLEGASHKSGNSVLTCDFSD